MIMAIELRCSWDVRVFVRGSERRESSGTLVAALSASWTPQGFCNFSRSCRAQSDQSFIFQRARCRDAG